MDASTRTVVETNHGDAKAVGQVHDLVDLLGEDFAKGSAIDGEVLGEHTDLATLDRAKTGDDPVGIGAVVLKAHAVCPVTSQHVEFLERALIKQILNPLTGSQLALGVLTLD